MYLKKLTDRLVLRNALPADAGAMGDLQRRVFPTLSPSELLTERHFAQHIKTFPEGQLVVTFNNTVIASTSTLRCRYPSPRHTFLEITGDLTICTHDPDGEWLYGFDMGVDPALQGLGFGRYLYAARNEIARMLNMSGQVITGMPSGYGKVKATLPFDEYYTRLLSGEVFDPTVSVQMKMGFEPDAVIADYLNDPKCGNYGVMMKLSADRVIPYPRMAVEDLEMRVSDVLTHGTGGLQAAVEIDRSPAGADARSVAPQRTESASGAEKSS